MPRHDQTGPMGHGARTGRGAGFCTGAPLEGSRRSMQAPGNGRGFGRSRGFRGGMGRGPRAGKGAFCTQSDPRDEQNMLVNQREALQSRLHAVNQRLEELSARESKED